MILTYLKIALAVAVVGGAAIGGYKVADWRWKASMLEAEQKHTEALAAEISRTNDIAAELETERGRQKLVYKTITKRVEKVVTRDVYRSECIDDDGLFLINAALLGQTAREPKPSDAVPAPRPLRR